MRRALVVALAAMGACGGKQHGGSSPTCAEAAYGAARNLREIRGDLGDAGVEPGPPLEALCKRDRWSEAAIRCYRDAASPKDAHACSVKLDDLQRLHARKAQDDLFAEATRVLRAKRLHDSATGIPECDDYVAAVDAYMQCTKIPEAAREAMKEGRDAMVQSLQQAGSDPSARDNDISMCKAATDALKQSMSAMGC